MIFFWAEASCVVLKTLSRQHTSSSSFLCFVNTEMSAVNITNVTVLDNPASFLTPFQFEISYECLTALKDGNSFLLFFFYFRVSILYSLFLANYFDFRTSFFPVPSLFVLDTKLYDI